MSALQGGNDNTAVVESFKEALKQRIGADHFRMWFTHGVTFGVEREEADAAAIRMLIEVQGQFALDRLRRKFMRELRAAVHAGCGGRAKFDIQLASATAIQAELPFDLAGDQGECVADRLAASGDCHRSGRPVQAADSPPVLKRRRGRSKSARSIGALVGGAASSTIGTSTSANQASTGGPSQLELPNLNSQAVDHASAAAERPNNSQDQSANNSQDQSDRVVRDAMSIATFIPGDSNRLAHTAVSMVLGTPSSASPLFLFGPTGTGKTHLLTAIAEQFRRRHRMRRVIQLSAEQFTNDFISSVGNSGISSFRRRYREVDALLVDDVQFLSSKRATLREMLYTVETLALAGRPMVFAANQPPCEIPGLTEELAGRMSSGLLCPLHPLDQSTRATLFRRSLQSRCPHQVPESIQDSINGMLVGDGRVVRAVVNLINTLQRMLGRMPTLNEIRQYGGDLLRGAKPVATLSAIEQAVCRTFQLADDSLRTPGQTRAISEPRMLAMHLSRELTSAAFAEIGGHYGGRSHSTAIAAGKNVRSWLKDGKLIGRGHAAMTVQEAVDRIESLLRTG